jgi:ATP-dependent Clp protease ATP-binding subunit ClpA
LPVIARLNELDENGLFEILTNPFNAVTQGKIRDFAAYGIELDFSEDALRLLSKSAHEEKTGARGLTRVMEKAVIPFEKRLPSTHISRLHFTEEMVENPAEMVEEIISGKTLQKSAEDFKEKTGVALSISPAAKRWLEENVSEGKTPGDLLTEKLESCEYGFSLLKKKNFQVTVKLLEDPTNYLEKLIKKSYE